MVKKKESLHDELSQEELDSLLTGFISEESISENKSLLEEIEDAILDSAKLSLSEWNNLRVKLLEIEKLIPHIDLIINLKSKRSD